MAPALYSNVKVTLFFNDDNLIVTSTDPRFDPVTRTITFDWTNWLVPAVIQVAAGSDDPHWGANLDDNRAEGSIFNVVTSTDPNYISVFGVGLMHHDNGDDPWGHMEWSDGHGWMDDHGWEDQGWSGQNGFFDWYGFFDGEHGWHPFPHPVPTVERQHPSAGRGRRLHRRVGRVDARRPGRPERRHVHDPADGPPGSGETGRRLAAERRPDDRERRVRPACDPRFNAGDVALRAPSVTFDSTNWYLPFTVRLTSNPSAPPTDPFQPMQVFPNAAGRAGLRDRQQQRRLQPRRRHPLQQRLVRRPRLGRRPGLGRRARLVRRPALARRRRLLRRPRRLVLRRRRLVRRPQLALRRRAVAPQPALQRRQPGSLVPRRLERLGLGRLLRRLGLERRLRVRGPARAAARHPPDRAGRRAAAGVHVGELRPHGRGDERGRRDGHVRPGAGARRGRPGDDQLLAGLRDDLPDRDDDREPVRDRPGRQLPAHELQHHRPRHDAAA